MLAAVDFLNFCELCIQRYICDSGCLSGQLKGL